MHRDGLSLSRAPCGMIMLTCCIIPVTHQPSFGKRLRRLRDPSLAGAILVRTPPVALVFPMSRPALSIYWISARATASRRALRARSSVFSSMHRVLADDRAAIAKRHGIKPNPLYLLGASRVGCWPCINVTTEEIALIARHTPERIDLIRDWEWRASMVSRR